MSKNKGIFGLILIVLGTLLLLKGLGVIFFTFGSLMRNLLPFGLIAIGISMIVRRRHRDHAMHTGTGDSSSHPYASGQSDQPNMAGTSKYASAAAGQASPESSDYSKSERLSNSPDGTEDGWIKYSKLIGDMHIDFAGHSLEKIDVSSFLGDTEIKLIDGNLSKGLNRLIVSGFIGDVRIFLPRNMAHMVQCSNFIGDIEVGAKRTSGISNRIDTQSQDYEQAESKLFIAANSFLGDIRIYVM